MISEFYETRNQYSFIQFDVIAVKKAIGSFSKDKYLEEFSVCIYTLSKYSGLLKDCKKDFV